MNRVIHFEIHAENPERVAEFYRQVFAWDVSKWDNPAGEYWLIVSGPVIEEGKVAGPPGINGGILRRRGAAPKGGEPVNAFVCTIKVPSVDEYLKRIPDAGGTLAAPKQAMPGLAWLAYCKDPDGNIFGIYEDDPSAK